jgi:RNA polymerase sigma-70 factor (ECF subfamily)
MRSSLLLRADSRVNGIETANGAREGRQYLSDEELLRLCARGECTALEELVRRYQRPIYRFLYRLLGSPEDAEETVLDVFVRTWQHAGRFQFRASVSAWLYRIAGNLARDVYNRRKTRLQASWQEARETALPTDGSAEIAALQSMEREERVCALHRAMRLLSASDRLLLVLYYVEERSYKDIQTITGCSNTVLKTRLARARQRLRSMLAEVNDTDFNANHATGKPSPA